MLLNVVPAFHVRLLILGGVGRSGVYRNGMLHCRDWLIGRQGLLLAVEERQKATFLDTYLHTRWYCVAFIPRAPDERTRTNDTVTVHRQFLCSIVVMDVLFGVF